MEFDPGKVHPPHPNRNELIDMAVREAMGEDTSGWCSVFEAGGVCLTCLGWIVDDVKASWPKLSRAEENAG
jgi:hypothetical protein